MRKLIELGDLQSDKLKEILKEQQQYHPKRTSKFSVITDVDDIIGSKTHYLVTNTKLDIHYYGQLMYMLGMKIKF